MKIVIESPVPLASQYLFVLFLNAETGKEALFLAELCLEIDARFGEEQGLYTKVTNILDLDDPAHSSVWAVGELAVYASALEVLSFAVQRTEDRESKRARRADEARVFVTWNEVLEAVSSD